MLRIAITDILRATLPLRSGNEGWIGVSPDGAKYHVVVPVDAQIARGVMACNKPTDGTPFGGYNNWIYFRCPPYEDNDRPSEELRRQYAEITAKRLESSLRARGIEASVQGGAP
jgi:hypothetical protein